MSYGQARRELLFGIRDSQTRKLIMLTPQDDLIGHQLPATFDEIDNSDPAWMERL